MAQFLQFLVGEDGVMHLDEPGAFGRGLQQIAFAANHDIRRGNDFLADRVDRRVGHLGEQLLEVIVQQLRLLRQDRQRRVGTHGAQRLDTVPGHGPNNQAQVFK